MALDIIVGDGLGIENKAQLQFGMWLVEFPSQGDHYTPLPILNGWLRHLLEFFYRFRGRFCSL